MGYNFLREGFDHSQLKAALCVSGLLGTLVMYGVFQERIMTHNYGSEGEKFETSLLLVFVNRLCTCLVSGAICFFQASPASPLGLPVSPPGAPASGSRSPLTSPRGEQSTASTATEPPPHHYLAVSLANILATTCQFEALKFVTFPVQTLVKCSKMIPVMIWGTMMMGKRYKSLDYSVAVAVMCGCTLFLATGDVTTVADAAHHNLNHPRQETTQDMRQLYYGYSMIGATLLILHLACDGFASTFQDKLFQQHKMSFSSMSFHVTLYSALVALAGLLIRRELIHSTAFALRHPLLLRDMAALSMAATSSQLLISYTIRTFGALLFATVQTMRQFLSILLSCILFSHAVSLPQVEEQERCEVKVSRWFV